MLPLIEFDNALRFALKTQFSKFKATGKTQTVRVFKGYSAAGRPFFCKEMGKLWQVYQLQPNMSECLFYGGSFQVWTRERPVLSVVTSARDYSKRADENLTNLYTKWKAWLRPIFKQDIQASCLHTQKFLQATKLAGNSCFLNFIRRMLLCGGWRDSL